MEVKIGFIDSPREVVVTSNQASDDVEAAVRKVIETGKGVLELSDEKGHRFLIRGERVAYIELGQADSRRVGFASL